MKVDAFASDDTNYPIWFPYDIETYGNSLYESWKNVMWKNVEAARVGLLGKLGPSLHIQKPWVEQHKFFILKCQTAVSTLEDP